ncbi:hypothetical protein M0811_03253 [Anaeramoeba ignava]|uniref:Uncharacterized protein n=1 Tax=Anaeramoeba ignava TaxID=1746090 RepID=A0A9Q0R4H2_ANAIG|nr:hypothetical protein M0811_03253 [Anaeramoeba ignava]
MYLEFYSKSRFINFLLAFCCTIIISCVFLIPSISIAYPDRDIECPKKLWTWIVICNIFFVLNLFFSFLLNILSKNVRKLSFCVSGLFSLFLIIWAIIGLVWAKSDGVKDECGKLYNVTLGDSIALISLIGLACCIFTCLTFCGLLLFRYGVH